MEIPRLTVYRSNKHVYAQIINDENASVLCSASSLSKEMEGSSKGGKNKDIAKKVGELLASKAIEKNISKVVFDRNGYLYHGRVRELAEACREKGLKF